MSLLLGDDGGEETMMLAVLTSFDLRSEMTDVTCFSLEMMLMQLILAMMLITMVTLMMMMQVMIVMKMTSEMTSGNNEDEADCVFQNCSFSCLP